MKLEKIHELALLQLLATVFVYAARFAGRFFVNQPDGIIQ